MSRELNFALSRIALSDQVMRLIQERILDGDYVPGERLNIDAISREINVSSSPIREALMRLSAAGLVKLSPFTVAPVPKREWFEQLLVYRIVAEGWAARQVAQRRPPEAIEQMTQSLWALERSTLGRRWRNYILANKADESFHETMLAFSGNNILAESVRNLHPHLHHARLFSKVLQDIAPVIAEHRLILAAIIAGDEDRAAEALESHLRASWKRYDGWTIDGSIEASKVTTRIEQLKDCS